MPDLIPRDAVLAILASPEALDTFPDMVRRVEALPDEGAAAVAAALERAATVAIRHWEGEPEDTIAMRDEIRALQEPLP